MSAWIAEVQGERLAAQRVLEQAPQQSWSPAEIRALLDELGDVRDVLASADATDEAEVYASLGLTMTYRPDAHTVEVVATPLGWT